MSSDGLSDLPKLTQLPRSRQYLNLGLPDSRFYVLFSTQIMLLLGVDFRGSGLAEILERLPKKIVPPTQRLLYWIEKAHCQ